MTAYQLKPWTQVVTPHPDIRDGNLDNAVFAASLSAVIREDVNCPQVYKDPRSFFEATYLTRELRQLLEDVLQVLAGKSGDRVLQLRTPFGGGKTHTLVSLYHLTQHRDKLTGMPQLESLPNPGKVDVASFIGLDMDVTTGIEVEPGKRVLTPWGYLAWQLGGQETYQLVAEQDRQRIAPGNDILRQLFSQNPTLILIDEFLVYVENAMALQVEDSNLGRQVLTFMQKLTEVVRDLPQVVMVYSLQASVQEAVGNEGLLSVLDKLVSRIDAKKEPVSGDEVMRVIQRRLFTTVGDITTIREVARQQADLYRKFRQSYAETNRESQEIEAEASLLAERIEASYPFHPDLLDLMYNRWGSLPSYQRTRGALQFLAKVVYALWTNNDPSWLIAPGTVPLNDGEVKQAFFSQVGERNAYDSVFSADLTGRRAKVKLVDSRIASDAPALTQLKVGTRLATAIMLYSFGAKGGEERGVREQEVACACLDPQLERTSLTSALKDLRDELLYLHYVGRKYRFETKPNLNKLIAEEQNKLTGDEVLAYVRTGLETMLQGARGKVVVWPADSSRVSDRLSQFQVIYLSPDWAEKSPQAISEELMQWVEYRGNDKREYKNGLAFVVPNGVQMERARTASRTTQAIAQLLREQKKYKFSQEDMEELTAKQKNAETALNSALQRLYEAIVLPIPARTGTNPLQLEQIDLQSHLNTSQKLQERVLDALKNHVFETVTVTKLVRLTGLSEEKPYLQGKELVAYFFKFPDYPKLLSEKPIKTAILQAIEQGKLGYVPTLTIPQAGLPTLENAALISYHKAIPADELDLDGYLITPNLVETLQAQLTSPDEGIDTDPPPIIPPEPEIEETGASTPPSPPEVVVEESAISSISRSILSAIKEGKQPAKSYTLDSLIDKAHLFDVIQALQTLSDQADQMNIHIKVRATKADGFDVNWLRNAIEEPLDEQEIRASTKIE
jgi:hypothetical protein